jgi:hypothetical protein
MVVLIDLLHAVAGTLEDLSAIAAQSVRLAVRRDSSELTMRPGVRRLVGRLKQPLPVDRALPQAGWR